MNKTDRAVFKKLPNLVPSLAVSDITCQFKQHFSSFTSWHGTLSVIKYYLCFNIVFLEIEK